MVILALAQKDVFLAQEDAWKNQLKGRITTSQEIVLQLIEQIQVLQDYATADVYVRNETIQNED